MNVESRKKIWNEKVLLFFICFYLCVSICVSLCVWVGVCERLLNTQSVNASLTLSPEGRLFWHKFLIPKTPLALSTAAASGPALSNNLAAKQKNK